MTPWPYLFFAFVILSKKTIVKDRNSMTKIATVSVHALSAGHLTLPERFFISPLENEASKITVPSMSFLIIHTDLETGKVTRLVFDLGIRRKTGDYAKSILEHISTRQPLSGTPDVVGSLASGGLGVEDIDGVIFSHLHWDHIGTPSDFPSTAYIIGPGAGSLTKEKQHTGGHNHFETGLLDQGRTIELSATDSGHESLKRSHAGLELRLRPLANRLSQPWQTKGPFEHTIDVFGDSSVYIVSAPGHLPGHINLLCRTRTDGHVYLAGDAFHDIRLLTGEKKIATWLDDSQSVCCIHSDRKQAERTISTIREAVNTPAAFGAVEAISAHDAAWASRAWKSGCFFPGAL